MVTGPPPDELELDELELEELELDELELLLEDELLDELLDEELDEELPSFLEPPQPDRQKEAVNRPATSKARAEHGKNLGRIGFPCGMCWIIYLTYCR